METTVLGQSGHGGLSKDSVCSMKGKQGSLFTLKQAEKLDGDGAT